MVVAEDDVNHFSWEGFYARPWEAVVEAADGSLVVSGGSRGRMRAGEHQVHVGVKRGVLRSVFLIVDASRAASEADADFKPTRLAAIVEAASIFVAKFFEQNPVSTLAVIVMRGGCASQLSEPSCNPRQHLKALASLGAEGARADAGEASLQNALQLARESLHAMPGFTSREVLLLSASLSTCDPGNILTTIASLQRDKLRCSIVSLSAEVFVCRKIAADTGGDYGVPTSSDHLRELVLRQVAPRPILSGGAAPSNALIRVAFPARQPSVAPTLGFAPGASAHAATVLHAPFRCPQCSAAHSDLPTQCQICQLKLMSSTELTKTYHHLFPVQSFTETKRPREDAAAAGGAPWGGSMGGLHAEDAAGAADAYSARSRLAVRAPAACCFACAEPLPTAAARAGDAPPPPLGGLGGLGGGGGGTGGLVSGAACPGCQRLFCASCDELVHGVLRVCPGCELDLGAQPQEPPAE